MHEENFDLYKRIIMEIKWFRVTENTSDNHLDM